MNTRQRSTFFYLPLLCATPPLLLYSKNPFLIFALFSFYPLSNCHPSPPSLPTKKCSKLHSSTTHPRPSNTPSSQHCTGCSPTLEVMSSRPVYIKHKRTTVDRHPRAAKRREHRRAECPAEALQMPLGLRTSLMGSS